jgi:hypothetical protein
MALVRFLRASARSARSRMACKSRCNASTLPGGTLGITRRRSSTQNPVDPAETAMSPMTTLKSAATANQSTQDPKNSLLGFLIGKMR